VYDVYDVAGKGRIARGYDADLTVVDLNATTTLTDAAMASRSGCTPFHGMQVHGVPTMIFVRGRLVMREGEQLGEPAGAPVRFAGALPAEG